MEGAVADNTNVVTTQRDWRPQWYKELTATQGEGKTATMQSQESADVEAKQQRHAALSMAAWELHSMAEGMLMLGYGGSLASSEPTKGELNIQRDLLVRFNKIAARTESEVHNRCYGTCQLAAYRNALRVAKNYPFLFVMIESVSWKDSKTGEDISHSFLKVSDSRSFNSPVYYLQAGEATTSVDRIYKSFLGESSILGSILHDAEAYDRDIIQSPSNYKFYVKEWIKARVSPWYDF